MKRTTPATPTPEHNYVRKLHYLWRVGAIPREGGLHLLTVWHDDWCGVYNGQLCNCDPDSTLKATVPGTMP